jgi:hypothetical protein
MSQSLTRVPIATTKTRRIRVCVLVIFLNKLLPQRYVKERGGTDAADRVISVALILLVVLKTANATR